MTPTEAAALASLGARDRRLLAALVRALTDRSTADDLEVLPERASDEPLIRVGLPMPAPRRDPDRAGCRGGTSKPRRRRNSRARPDIGTAAVPLSTRATQPLLASIPDPPPLALDPRAVTTLVAPAVAIVGSRAATPYGLAMAAQIAARPRRAPGWSSFPASRAASTPRLTRPRVSAGGKTVGVLGCGIDRIYPAEHGDLARNIEHERRRGQRVPAGRPAAAASLSAAKPHHQRACALRSWSSRRPRRAARSSPRRLPLEQGRDVMVVPGPSPAVATEADTF